MKVMIDLFAGLGGASTAFWNHPDWLVLRIDNNEDLLPYTKGLIMADITDFDAVCAIIDALMPEEVEQLVIWASPPCLEFSNAFSSPRSKAQRAGLDYSPSMDCLFAALDIIEHYSPEIFWIENVRGATKYFEEEIGTFRQRIGQFFLWGQFPLIALREARHRYLTKPDKRHSPIRANIRAEIPEEISKAVLASIEFQGKLF